MEQQVDEHGLPIPHGFDEEPRQRPAFSGSARRIMRLLLAVVVVVALVAGLLHSPLGNRGRLTIAETYFATAREKMQAGQFEAALADLETAISWSQESSEVYYLQAQALQQLRRHEEALAAANKLLEMAPHFAPGYGVRGLVLQQLKRYDAAIADLEEAARLAADGDPWPLNNLAYVRALAGDDLPQALDEAQQSVKLAGKPIPASILDTRGYIYYLLERHDEALADLDAAVEAADRTCEETLDDPLFEQLTAEQQQYVHQQVDEPLAIMLHHRGQIHEVLENDDEAQADFQRADELGYDPEAGVF